MFIVVGNQNIIFLGTIGCENMERHISFWAQIYVQDPKFQVRFEVKYFPGLGTSKVM